MRSARRRTRNGVPVYPEERFYCAYGKHYVLPLDYETQPANKGVCMACAFEIYDMLRMTIYVPEITPAARIKAVNEWRASRDVAVAKRRVRAGSKDPGWVYYVAQDNLIKIGYAKDVTKRIKAYGPTAKLLAVHPGTLQTEKAMHTKFHASLDSGREWFRRDEALMTHIAEIREQFGDPAIFEYQYTKPKTEEEKVREMFATRGYSIIANGVHSSR